MKSMRIAWAFTIPFLAAMTLGAFSWRPLMAAENEACTALKRLDSLIAEWETHEIIHPSKIETLKDIADALRDCADERAAKEAAPFSGRWYTDFGIVELKQTDDKVEGAYEKNEGEIEGAVNGDTLEGKWSEPPTYSEPEDKGDFQFILSEDGKSFRGKWRKGSQGEWQYGWNGDRE
jgi:hypothetical protein